MDRIIATARPAPGQAATSGYVSDDYRQGWIDAIRWAGRVEGYNAPDIANRVREHIRTHGVRQWRLADDAGMSADALSARLTGQTPWHLQDVLGLVRAGVDMGIPTDAAQETRA